MFQHLDLGIECALRCKAMELESLRCIVRRLERVVAVRPTCELFLLETVSQGTLKGSKRYQIDKMCFCYLIKQA